MRKLYSLEAHKETLAFLSIESLVMRPLAELWELPAGIKVDGPQAPFFSITGCSKINKM